MMEFNNKGMLWMRLKILGNGAFGQVTLWQNSKTQKKLAIKILHEHIFKDHSFKKQFERWCNEVEIMKKLKHPNIVSALELPSELDKCTNFPILAMEYCSLGNLRQVLIRSENCCGLKEIEILNILKDVSQGLAYLHSCKIIHRDLKPDNIVLQEEGLNTVYKLIDLGYAKEFDENSLSKSFVGTIQYVAPELFMGKPYTSSVDYWSFGLLTHEIINGYRPFLPELSPSDWMKKIQNKERKIINVLENDDGRIDFNSSISRKNYLSGCYIKDIETWLQIALDWNGHTRGRDLETNRLVIFENLSKIISKKVIKVFSMSTYRFLSYEVKMEVDISNLRDWLQSDTGLNINNQLLLLPNGKCLGMRGNLLNCFKNEKSNGSNINLFLYNKGEIWVENKISLLSDFDCKTGCSEKFSTYKHLKRGLAKLIYYFQNEAMKYKYFVQGIKVKIGNLKEIFLAIDTLHKQIKEEWNKVENFGQFLFESHKIDLENYIYHRRTGGIKICELVQKWIQSVIDVNHKIMELKNLYEKDKKTQMTLIAAHRCHNLENYMENDIFKGTYFNKMVNQAKKLWEDLQTSKGCNDRAEFLFLNALSLYDTYVSEAENLLSNKTLRALFLEIEGTEENLIKLFKHFTFLLKSLKVLKLIIGNTQRARQKEIWDLVSHTKKLSGSKKNDSKFTTDIENKPEVRIQKLDNEGGNFHNFCNMKSQSESESHKFRKFFIEKIDVTDLQYKFTNSEAVRLIEENYQLRHRIQEVQHEFRQTLKELRSLD